MLLPEFSTLSLKMGGTYNNKILQPEFSTFSLKIGPTYILQQDFLQEFSTLCLIMSGTYYNKILQPEFIAFHSALMIILIKLFQKRKQLLQHESITPIESGITLSQILQIQN